MNTEGPCVACAVQPAPQMPLQGFRARLWAWLHMLFVDHSIFRFFFNLRQEIAPRLYRSSHPMPYQIRAGARAGVKTILSLRGPESHIGSNRLEWDTAAACGIKVVHLPMGSRDAPSPQEILGLIQAFETLEYPLWIHCKSGADRAGFAAALYQFMFAGKALKEAQHELRFWWHGHVRQAKTGVLDHFFDCCVQAGAGDAKAFVSWLKTSYDRGAVRRSFREQWWAAMIVDRILRRE